MQNFRTLGQPLLGEKYVTKKKNNPKISGHYIPAATPKGSTRTLVRPIRKTDQPRFPNTRQTSLKPKRESKFLLHIGFMAIFLVKYIFVTLMYNCLDWPWLG